MPLPAQPSVVPVYIMDPMTQVPPETEHREYAFVEGRILIFSVPGSSFLAPGGMVGVLVLVMASIVSYWARE